MSRTLIETLRSIGRSGLAREAETLTQERDEALLRESQARVANAQLRRRLHEVISARNADLRRR